ncbi:MAG: hypothetical protein RSG55_08790, partial [Oscillospiraceae bacterium]
MGLFGARKKSLVEKSFDSLVKKQRVELKKQQAAEARRPKRTSGELQSSGSFFPLGTNRMMPMTTTYNG